MKPREPSAEQQRLTAEHQARNCVVINGVMFARAFVHKRADCRHTGRCWVPHESVG